MGVEVICTTDDPVDDLRYHAQLNEEQVSFRMLPAFRPDKSILIEKDGFQQYIAQLGTVSNISINSFDDLLQALAYRMDFFGTLGCRLADHGLEQIYAADFTHHEADRILVSRLEGTQVSAEEANVYKSALLHNLGCMYAARGWVQQFHLGAMRNNNTRMMQTIGADAGYDSIGDYGQATALSRYFDQLDRQNSLAKTIIYNLNPADNEIFATMIGNYHDGKTKGKMQFGSAWWFLDQKHGMTEQLNALSNMGLLSCFIGMLTDSRSFMAFPRHEYFRRLLCNLIGKDVHNGELPDDTKWLGGIVEDICYRNAKTYFEL
jgi:glucuronate isomerase